MSWMHRGLILSVSLAGACDRPQADPEELEDAESQASSEQAQVKDQTRDAILEATREVHENAARAAREDQLKSAAREGREGGPEANLEEASRQAGEALKRARVDVSQALTKQLDSLDDRAQRLKRKLDGKETVKDRSMKDAVTKVEQGVRDVRRDLQEFESGTVASIEQFRVRLDQSLAALNQALTEVEGEV